MNFYVVQHVYVEYTDGLWVPGTVVGHSRFSVIQGRLDIMVVRPNGDREQWTLPVSEVRTVEEHLKVILSQ